MHIVKKMLPHGVAIVVFLLVSVIYFAPVLEGKRLKPHDIVQFSGASREVGDFKKDTGKESLWTNSMFGGMPTYQIAVAYHNNWTGYLHGILALRLPAPVHFLFIAFIGFYIMLLCFKVDPWLSIAGALAYGLSTYFLIIIGAGHNTKMRALSFVPPLIGGIRLVYHRRQIWAGAILTCLALALQIRSNHFQITYYAAIIILIFMVFELIHVFKNNSYSRFIRGSAMLLLALTLAVCVNITNMLLTIEYTPDSTRGASELSNSDGDQTKGLDKSYILNDYSYGIAETMNLFIPDFMGGASWGKASAGTPFYKALEENGVQRNTIAQITGQVPLYWGEQRFTAGPVYIGAVIVFLFVVGLFVVKGSVKWWLLSATIVSIVLAWGKNCMFISDLFIDYFPGYNKFRTVSMILVIAELTIPLLGILAVKELLSDRLTLVDKKKAIKKSLFITGGIALFFTLLPGALFGFNSPADNLSWLLPNTREYDSLRNSLTVALIDTRKYILRMDALRSLIFVLASAAVLWFVVNKKIKTGTSYLLFAVLITIDLWQVDKRYMNNSHFVAAKETATPVYPTAANTYILKDTTLNYRVLNLNNPFNEANTSYFHKSIGGYHGAKMKRYQELIDHHLSREINGIISKLQSAKTDKDVEGMFAEYPVLNMLNTRYVIYAGDQPPLTNRQGLGNAWTVRNIRWVNNADEEIAALSGFDPTKEAIIDKRFENILEDFAVTGDSAARITLTAYEPNHLTYEYNSPTPQLAVFSEIYYGKGWKAYIDGELAPHVRANYVLRAMEIPAGTHRIEFKFESQLYTTGENISLAGSVGIVLLLVGGAIVAGKKRRTTAKG
ncbi:MAG: YfhO family protein [Bacteroidales bacterium]|jgi:hypothetical protein|nr:YfhO family protein [Bacteroidales bacterium]